MAYDLSEVPEGVRDILAHMPREMQQRVLADYETHYAPFLAMLAGWKGAVQAHYAFGEDSAIARLQEQFFPLGDWKFPAQGLAVPQRPPERTTDVAFGAALQDPALRPWLACGDGWLHPTQLRDAVVQWVDRDVLFNLEAEHLGVGSLEPLLERGQLVFVAAPDAVVAALESAEWWVQTPGAAPRPARATRYDGYMAFERELQVARLQQRHLDLWLPPFYPYARKILCLALEKGRQDSPGVPPELDLLRRFQTGFRFAAMLRNPDGRAVAALRAMGGRGEPMARLNPIPTVQAAVDDSVFFPPFPRAGSEYALRVAGAPDIFAAVAYADNVAVPASMVRVPSNDPLARELDVQVQFTQVDARTARIKVYHGSFGQERADNSDTPSLLQMTPLRFQVPYRIVGGLTVEAPETRARWTREAWYHSVLRPPLLTEGDLVELFQQRKGTFSEFLRFRYATREIVHDPDQGNLHWRTYLWPTLIAREDSFDARYGEIPAANYIPLIQCLRLAFERAVPSVVVPDFLLTDMAEYLASVLSQYFVLSCFRVEGRIV